MTNVAVIGAGWLGEPLARELNSRQHHCIVTRRTQKGIDSLRGLSGFVADLSDVDAETKLINKLRKNDIRMVVGTFPPGFRKGKGSEYTEWWQTVVNACIAAGVSKIVMVSSTSVYPSGPGVMSEELSEYSLAINNTQFSDKARRMLEAEKRVKESNLCYAIVRLSGLFGPQRNPARFIAKLPAISRSAPANMLHLDDAIGSVAFACTNIENDIVNATTPNTVSKADFYGKAAQLAGMSASLPETVDIKDKQISSDKIIRLGYSFKYQHVYEALNSLS